MKKASQIIVLILFFFLPLILSACTGTTSAENTIETGIGTVTKITLTKTIEASGSITPRQIASVSWETNGTIESVNFEVGEQVQKGEVLMTLDPDSVPDSLIIAQRKLKEMTSAASIAEAEEAVLALKETLKDAEYARSSLDYYDQDYIDDSYASYLLAKTKYDSAYENYENFLEYGKDDPKRASAYQAMYDAQVAMESALSTYNYATGTSSQLTYDTQDNAITLAKLQLAEAKNYLLALKGKEVPEDATGSSLLNLLETRMSVDAINLRAPFTGIVAAIYDEKGMLVSNNQASVKLIDYSKLFITILLEESEMILVSPGMSVDVSVEVLPDLELTGRIIRIEPIGTISNGVVYYDVVVELDQVEEKIPINASATVSIQIGEPETQLLVPATAIQSDDAGEFVQLIDNNAYQRVDVVSGTIMSDDTVVVTGNLAVGDQVLLILEAASTGEENVNFGGFGILGGGGDRREMPSDEIPQGGGQVPPSAGQ